MSLTLPQGGVLFVVTCSSAEFDASVMSSFISSFCM